MRFATVIGLCLAASSPAIGADRAIPQDPAHMAKWSRDRLEWNRQTLQGAYDKVGKKNPRWDGPAREGLELAARMFSQQIDPLVTLADIHVPVKKAIEAGCDDPMILYLHARTSVGKNHPGDAEYTRRSLKASDAMSASRYPPIRRAVALVHWALHEAFRPEIAPETRVKVEEKLDSAVDLIAISAVEDPRGTIWDEGWYQTLNDAIGSHRKMTGEYKAAFDRVDARLAKVAGIEALRLAVKGQFLVRWGWETRGTTGAEGVRPDDMQRFGERLFEARKVLLESWKKNPGGPNVARVMVEVEKSIGGGDREAMETWFERAMIANPFDFYACWAKLDWLDPKWHGESFDEQLAFGRACRATKNWRTGITLLIVEAHFRAYKAISGEPERLKYLRTPKTWSEIASAFIDYLDHNPGDNVQRSRFAVVSYLTAEHKRAYALFQTLGNQLTTWPGYPQLILDQVKKYRDDNARIIEGKPREAAAARP